MSWYLENAQGDQHGFVVVEAMLGASRSDESLPLWKRQVLDRLSVLMSNAAAQVMHLINQHLVVVMQRADRLEERRIEQWPWRPDEHKWVVDSARLVLRVDEERANRVRDLLAQPIKPYGYTNAYRFVEINEDSEPGYFLVTAEIAKGECKETKRGLAIHKLSMIPATTGLQQLLAGYLMAPYLLALPRLLRAGACQEAAQQVTSLLGQLESAKVKGEVAFPTVEDRDPARRRAAYETAIDALVTDVRPLNVVPIREKQPVKFAADDPRGNRLIVDDERWFAITRTPEPHQIPLFFVDSNSVRIQMGEGNFAAGVSKANRHRGRFIQSQRVLESRPMQVQEKGQTGIRAFYALLPVLDTDDPVIRRILDLRDVRKTSSRSRGRGLMLQMHQSPIQSGVTNRVREQDLRIPLSFDRRRFERTLMRGDVQIAWAKVLKKNQQWVMQLTLRIPFSAPVGIRRVMAVSFGLDAIMSWLVVDHDGEIVDQGEVSPNPQIKAYLEQKISLEWDQQKGRWIGGRRFERELESIAHSVSNKVIQIAKAQDAVVAVHEIQYVEKAGRDSQTNQLFTAWNYGQLARMLGYKSPISGLGNPVFVSDFKVRMTCPRCGACWSKEDPKNAPTIWRVKDILHCRACNWQGTPNREQQMRLVAKFGLEQLKAIWEKEDAV